MSAAITIVLIAIAFNLEAFEYGWELVGDSLQRIWTGEWQKTWKRKRMSSNSLAVPWDESY